MCYVAHIQTLLTATTAADLAAAKRGLAGAETAAANLADGAEGAAPVSSSELSAAIPKRFGSAEAATATTLAAIAAAPVVDARPSPLEAASDPAVTAGAMDCATGEMTMEPADQCVIPQVQRQQQ